MQLQEAADISWGAHNRQRRSCAPVAGHLGKIGLGNLLGGNRCNRSSEEVTSFDGLADEAPGGLHVGNIRSNVSSARPDEAVQRFGRLSSRNPGWSTVMAGLHRDFHLSGPAPRSSATTDNF